MVRLHFPPIGKVIQQHVIYNVTKIVTMFVFHKTLFCVLQLENKISNLSLKTTEAQCAHC